MGVNDIFLPDGAFEEYNKKVKKQKEAQDSIIVWNPDDDIPKPNVVQNFPIAYDDTKPVDTVDIKVKNGLFNMPKIVPSPKIELTAQKIEKTKRKYTKKEKIKVKIMKMSENATRPSKKYSDDACFDICAAEEVNIGYGDVAKIRTGIAVRVPSGYVGKVFCRSGLASEGFFVVNSPGIVDASYTGELFVILGNINKRFDNDKYKIQKGDRIAQFAIEKVESFEFEEVKELDKTDRGDKGIGSSGR